MRELTLREQLLLGLLLLIGLAFGGVYVQKQLAGQEALLQQQLDNRRQQLRQLQALASESVSYTHLTLPTKLTV